MWFELLTRVSDESLHLKEIIRYYKNQLVFFCREKKLLFFSLSKPSIFKIMTIEEINIGNMQNLVCFKHQMLLLLILCLTSFLFWVCEQIKNKTNQKFLFCCCCYYYFKKNGLAACVSKRKLDFLRKKIYLFMYINKYFLLIFFLFFSILNDKRICCVYMCGCVAAVVVSTSWLVG